VAKLQALTKSLCQQHIDCLQKWENVKELQFCCEFLANQADTWYKKLELL
jgi:hypothetical protein